MTRTAIRSGSTGVALPEWRAFAYDASGNLLGSVGENAVSVFSDISPKAFTLNGPNIRSVRIASDNHNFAAFSAVILDNFTVTAVPSVPEPQSLVLASIGCVMLLGNQVRKRWASSRSALSTYP